MNKLFQQVTGNIKALLQTVKVRPFHCTRQFSLNSDTVFVSQSQDIYLNLAFEDWLYKNVDFSTYSVLLMWKNKPAVVIGRHQNPFMESDVWKITEDSVDLARRNSGGGAVYHDEGNLNISFMKHRKRYNRHSNLELVIQAVQSRWENVDLTINTREDILLNGFYKVSGTASKLGRLNTYHHLTLLLNVDKNKLFRYLDSPFSTIGVNCRATQSLKTNVMNLMESIPSADFNSLVDVIGRKFLNQQVNEHNFKFISPCDSDFPGLQTIYSELTDRTWIYAKTSKFTIQRQFTKKFKTVISFSIFMEINEGRISSLEIETNSEAVFRLKPILLACLVNKPFWYKDLKDGLGIIYNDIQTLASDDQTINVWILQCIADLLCINL